MLEPWMIVVLCAVNAVLLGLAVLLFVAFIRSRNALNEIERHGISSAAGEVPSVVLENDTSVEIMLADGKRIVVSVLDLATGRTWRRLFLRFIVRHSTAVDMLPFLAFEELEDETQKARAVDGFSKMIGEYDMQREIASLLGKTILKRRLVERIMPNGARKMCRTRPNPDGITTRWLMKNATELQLAEIILIVYAYNNGAYVKKNFRSLLEKVAAVFPGMTGMRSFRQSSPGTERNGGDKPLYPDCRFTPVLTPKDQNMSAESLTKPGTSEKISEGECHDED